MFFLLNHIVITKQRYWPVTQRLAKQLSRKIFRLVAVQLIRIKRNYFLLSWLTNCWVTGQHPCNSPCVASPVGNSPQGDLELIADYSIKMLILVFLIVTNLFLKTLRLVAPTVCWSNPFHLLITLLEKSVNMITCERLNVGWWNLAVRCIVEKSRPSSNLWVIGPTPGSPHPKMWRFAESLRKKSTNRCGRGRSGSGPRHHIRQWTSCVVRQFYAGGKISACCLWLRRMPFTEVWLLISWFCSKPFLYEIVQNK